MLASVWYAKRMGRRLIRTLRGTKRLHLLVGVWQRCAGARLVGMHAMSLPLGALLIAACESFKRTTERSHLHSAAAGYCRPGSPALRAEIMSGGPTPSGGSGLYILLPHASVVSLLSDAEAVIWQFPRRQASSRRRWGLEQREMQRDIFQD